MCVLSSGTLRILTHGHPAWPWNQQLTVCCIRCLVLQHQGRFLYVCTAANKVLQPPAAVSSCHDQQGVGQAAYLVGVRQPRVPRIPCPSSEHDTRHMCRRRALIRPSCPLSYPLQVLLSVAGDGSICLVPLQQLGQASGHTFKQASGWSGYSQGRWVDSNIFATVGTMCACHPHSSSC